MTCPGKSGTGYASLPSWGMPRWRGQSPRERQGFSMSSPAPFFLVVAYDRDGDALMGCAISLPPPRGLRSPRAATASRMLSCPVVWWTGSGRSIRGAFPSQRERGHDNPRNPDTKRGRNVRVSPLPGSRTSLQARTIPGQGRAASPLRPVMRDNKKERGPGPAGNLITGKTQS